MFERCWNILSILLKLQALGPLALLQVDGPPVSNENFQCVRCQGLAPAIDKTALLRAIFDNDSIAVVDSLYYTGDMITSTGSCTKTLTGHGRTDWTKFKELLSLLTSETISL